MENFEFRPTSALERKNPLPLINAEERRFIENVGGEYCGYIRSDAGQKTYEQFRVARSARYDERRREAIETYIATEVIDRDGEKDLRSPADIAGFSILISELSRSGEEIGKPEILIVNRADFKDRQLTVAQLQEMARDVHVIASQKSVMLDSVELRAAVKEYLQSVGWGR